MDAYGCECNVPLGLGLSPPTALDKVRNYGVYISLALLLASAEALAGALANY